MWKPRPITDTLSSGSPAARPLLATGDADLLDELLRVAAAASVPVDVAAHAHAALRGWHGAPLVVVGDDLLDPLLTLAPRRRPGVVLACHEPTGLDAEPGLWRRAVALGAEHVACLPAADGWLVERFGASGDSLVPEGAVLALMGSRGGAGTSTLACAVAQRAAARGTSTVLLDLDPLGGGLDLPLALENEPGLRWPDLARASGRIAGGALAQALPRGEGPAVLAWDRGDPVDVGPEVVGAVVDAAARGFALVVADLPRGVDPVAVEVLRRAGQLMLVVPREVRALAAAGRRAVAAGAHPAPLGVVTRGPGPSGMDAATAARALGLDLVADVRTDARVAGAVERGEPLLDRAPLMRVADAVLARALPEAGAA